MSLILIENSNCIFDDDLAFCNDINELHHVMIKVITAHVITSSIKRNN